VKSDVVDVNNSLKKRKTPKTYKYQQPTENQSKTKYRNVS